MGYNALVFLLLVVCTIPYIQSGLRPWIDDDLLVQVMLVKSLQQGYPFQNIISEGRPLFYNFCYHAFIDATHILTGLPTFLSTVRLGVIFCFSSLFFVVLGFCMNQLKQRQYLLSSLFIFQLFAVIGYQAEIVGKIFGGTISAPMSRIPSNTLGFTFTFLLSDFVLFFLRDSIINYRQRLRLLGCILIIAFIAAGARSANMMFIAGGLGFLFSISLFYRNKDLSLRMLSSGTAVGMAFLGALIFFYGVHTPESASNFQSFQGLSGQIKYIMNDIPYAYNLSELRPYMPEQLVGFIIICVLLLLRAGFLSFAYIASMRFLTSSLSNINIEYFYYFGGFLLSSIMWLITIAPGGSHLTYLHYAGLGSSLLAITFLSTETFSSKQSKVIFAGTAALFCVHVTEVAYQLMSHKILITRRYQQKVSHYTDLVGPGLENIIGYLKQHAKNSAVAVSWNLPRDIDPIVSHLILAEAGMPFLNDPRYMHSDGIVSTHSSLYSSYLMRVNASQTFWQSPEKAIYELYQSRQDKKRTLYLLTDRPIDSTPFQTLKLEYVLDDSFQGVPYILYKVHIKASKPQ